MQLTEGDLLWRSALQVFRRIVLGHELCQRLAVAAVDELQPLAHQLYRFRVRKADLRLPRAKSSYNDKESCYVLESLQSSRLRFGMKITFRCGTNSQTQRPAKGEPKLHEV